jgi:hypothetical protein
MDDEQQQRGIARAAQEVARSLSLDRRPTRIRAADGESHFGPLFSVTSHRALPPVLLQQYDSTCDLAAPFVSECVADTCVFRRCAVQVLCGAVPRGIFHCVFIAFDEMGLNLLCA